MVKKAGFAHDDKDNITTTWLTPKWIFDELGLEFDLDPCSPEGGVPWIPAAKFYTEKHDGLIQPWEGRVWLNPPYGKHTGEWLKKMHYHRNGIALVFARTDCKWFHNYIAKSDGILFLKGRIKFVDALGKTGGSGAGAGSMLAAWGNLNAIKLESMARNGHGLFVNSK